MFTLQRGYDLPSRLRNPGTIPIVSSAGPYDFHDRHQVKQPGVVTGRYGTIGEVFYLEEDFWPLNTTLYVSDFKGNDPLYVSYLLRTVDFASHSGKSGVPGINRNDIHQLIVLRPPKAEQSAIAKALSDVDTLIISLEKLIAKKCAIKTAAMQQLLTGKKRLPPFDKSHTGYKQTELGVIPEDWEVMALSDITQAKRPISYGIVQTGPQVSGGIRCLRVIDISNGNISKDNLITTTVEISNSYRRTQLQLNDLVIPLRGKVGEVGLIDADLVGDNLTRGVALIALTGGYSSPFIKQVISFEDNANRIENSMNGSALQEISIAALRSFKISIPSASEQEAIADVLSGIDKDLDALGHQLIKTKQLKQGMMQELLTGKTRLVTGEA